MQGAAEHRSECTRRCVSEGAQAATPQWGRINAPYLTVSVPVIAGIGWTEQMKVYVPGWRGVYW